MKILYLHYTTPLIAVIGLLYFTFNVKVSHVKLKLKLVDTLIIGYFLYNIIRDYAEVNHSLYSPSVLTSLMLSILYFFLDTH